MSLRRRLVLFTAGAVSLAIVLASLVTYAVVRDNLRAQVDGALQELVPRVTVARRSAVSDTVYGQMPFLPTAPAPTTSGSTTSGSTTSGSPGEGTTTATTAPSPLDDTALGTNADGTAAGVETNASGRKRGRAAVKIIVPPDELGGASGIAQVITPDGNVVGADTGSAIPVDPTALAVVRGDQNLAFHDETVRGTHMRVLTTRDPFGGALQVARPLSDVDDSLDRLRWILLAVCVGGLFVGGGLGLGVSRATVRPVSRLTEAAEQVTETGDLRHRIDADGEDELGRLARSFNRMLGALEASRDAQRLLVADASHELRTPLTSARANIELLQRAPDLPEAERSKALGDVREQLEELTVLVGDLVDLARPREHLVEEPEDLALDALVGDAVARAQRNAPHVRFDLEAAPCFVRGSRMRISRAVSNLLDNAAKFSPDGGTVLVTVRDGVIVVRDHGPGLEPSDLPHVFDRFWRSSSARGLPGSGLGLAIVRHIAEGHGGRIEAANAPGGGALLRLTLPTVALSPNS